MNRFSSYCFYAAFGFCFISAVLQKSIPTALLSAAVPLGIAGLHSPLVRRDKLKSKQFLLAFWGLLFCIVSSAILGAPIWTVFPATALLCFAVIIHTKQVNTDTAKLTPTEVKLLIGAITAASLSAVIGIVISIPNLPPALPLVSAIAAPILIVLAARQV
ncbi:MAG: hypothetical protein ACLFR1_00735 [Spirochaetia bacterium]